MTYILAQCFANIPLSNHTLHLFIEHLPFLLSPHASTNIRGVFQRTCISKAFSPVTHLVHKSILK